MQVIPIVFHKFYEKLCDAFVKKEWSGKKPDNAKTNYSRNIWFKKAANEVIAVSLFKGITTINAEYFFRKNSELNHRPETEIDAMSFYKALLYLENKKPKIFEKNEQYEKEAREEWLKFVSKYFNEFIEDTKKLNEKPSAYYKGKVYREYQLLSQTKEEKNISEDNKNSQKKIDDVEFIDALNIVYDYYEGTQETFSHPYKEEINQYIVLKSLVEARLEIEKSIRGRNGYAPSPILQYLRSHFFNSVWEMYEKKGNKIIKKTILFGNKNLPRIDTSYGFKCVGEFKQKGKRDNELNHCEFDFLHRSITMQSDIYLKKPTDNFEIINISYKEKSFRPEICVGHKLTVKGNSGAMEMKIIVMRKTSDSRLYYSELGLYSKEIPDYIRSIFLCHGVIPVTPNPYLNKHITLGKISRFLSY